MLNLLRIGFMASEEMSFENVDDDGCLPKLYAYLLAFGSGELKASFMSDLAHSLEQNQVEIIISRAQEILDMFIYGPRQANLVLIAYASSEGSGEAAHSRSLARTSAARSYKQ